MRVKVYGAGSIGNHLAQASRRIGWDVAMVDNNPAALLRMKHDIYPKRYGVWDDAIQLYKGYGDPKGGFDIIMIGTPPDVRMKLAIEAAKEAPRLIHLEKPLYAPTTESVEDFERFKETLARYAPECIVTVGYDHAVSRAAQFVKDLLQQNKIGEVMRLEVAFKEHWKGIFAAHPWLKGPEDSYLGYWRRGGGAGCEHSHALHLWLYFAKLLGWGPVVDVRSHLKICRDGSAEYDKVADFSLAAESGRRGTVVQDVVTDPVEKHVCFFGTSGHIMWLVGGSPNGDIVRLYSVDGGVKNEVVIHKKRPDDFYEEVLHYDRLLNGEIAPHDSPLSLSLGAQVMEILCEAYSLATDGEEEK